MMNGTMNGFLLSILIWLPILGAVGVMMAGSHRPAMAKGLALLIASVTFLLGLPLFFSFDTSTAAMQFVESALD
jgi:NADH-quinone oxidoreductase subunit M